MAHRLTDIDPAEVSLVRKGANRRRFVLIKSDELEVDEDLARALEKPAEGEGELVDRLRKANATDEQLRLAVAAFRLMKSSNVQLVAAPEAATAAEAAFAKAMQDPRERRSLLEALRVAGTAGTAPAESATDAVAKRAADELDRLAVEIRKADRSLSKEQAFTKALEENPQLYEPARRHLNAELLKQADADARAEAEAIAKAAQPSTPAEVRIEKAARELRQRQPKLTPEQAYSRALTEQPELYEQHRQEQYLLRKAQRR